MIPVTVTIAGELVMDQGVLPDDVLGQVKATLTVKNDERDKAAGLKTFGWWDMPEYISLWREETYRGGRRVICFPRGFASMLQSGLAGMGYQVIWDDQRSTAMAAPGYYRMINLRGYQMEAALPMMSAEQGFYECPTGGGKTVTTLGIAALAGQRTLVIVDKGNLAEQWRERAAQFYGFPMEETEDGKLRATFDGDRSPGLLGNDVWEERDFTVALRQTLHSKGWSLDATKWWQGWGLVVFDEAHHLRATTTGDIARKITGKYLFGVSATPADSEMDSATVHSIVGPIVAQTSYERLYAEKVLVKPTIEVVDGDFEFDFVYDHDAVYDHEKKRWVCEKSDCNKNSNHGHRNNYASCLKNLVEDEDRAKRIAREIMARRGHFHLVPSSQKKHLDILKKALIAEGWPKDKIWLLTGKENEQGLAPKIISEFISDVEGVLFSTVADEGLDAPPIDVIHLVFPNRKRGKIIQIIGREKRASPGKEGAWCLDYREPKVSVFKAQAEERESTYRMQGYTIIHR